jgi:ATP-dependent RNA helicase SUPV3L1/SUV3
VASDAIGMGLNLSIGRIIFSSLEKFDGDDKRLLTHAEIKQVLASVCHPSLIRLTSGPPHLPRLAVQIAGRAGRYQSQYEVGLVTARKHGDLHLIHEALQEVDDAVDRAGLKPTREQLELFAKVGRSVGPSQARQWALAGG